MKTKGLTVILGEQRLETGNQVIHQVNKTLEHFNHGLTLDNLRLGERYIRGEIHIITHIHLAGSNYVAIFQRLSEAGKVDSAASPVAGFPITGDFKTHFRKVD